MEKTMTMSDEVEEPVKGLINASAGPTSREAIRWTLKQGIEDHIGPLRKALGGKAFDFDVFVVYGIPDLPCWRWGVILYGDDGPEVVTIEEFFHRVSVAVKTLET